MFSGRVCCALALSCFAACSFPDYRSSELAENCQNGVRDPDEVGIDCGGGCLPCAVCSDGIRNGDETDVDCGGDCAPCPSCSDSAQNGNESDVDCGGTCGMRCDVNQRCREDVDCASLVCSGVCEPPSCTDRVRNGHETGVDCGGSCRPCENGSACASNDDCETSHCRDQVCVDAACTDGILNGQESDVDCGGPSCGPCPASHGCQTALDCESGLCDETATCREASCSDAVQNQSESDVDCGGPNCDPCRVGGRCDQSDDCESALCQSRVCVPKSGSDQPLGKTHWKLSSSESTASGLSAPFDGDPGTCFASGTPQHSGMYVELDLGQQEIFFKALLRATAAPCQDDYPGTLDIYVSSDGKFGDPVIANWRGDQWTWIPFPSAQVARYVRFQLTSPSARPWGIGELNLYE